MVTRLCHILIRKAYIPLLVLILPLLLRGLVEVKLV